MTEAERIARLEEKVNAVHDDIHLIGGTIDRLWQAIEDLRRELTGRPTWAVTFALTVMSSLLVAACAAVVALAAG